MGSCSKQTLISLGGSFLSCLFVFRSDSYLLFLEAFLPLTNAFIFLSSCSHSLVLSLPLIMTSQSLLKILDIILSKHTCISHNEITSFSKA
jgi:hypothetical protein